MALYLGSLIAAHFVIVLPRYPNDDDDDDKDEEDDEEPPVVRETRE